MGDLIIDYEKFAYNDYSILYLSSWVRLFIENIPRANPLFGLSLSIFSINRLLFKNKLLKIMNEWSVV
jgi:hypothetical protein